MQYIVVPWHIGGVASAEHNSHNVGDEGHFLAILNIPISDADYKPTEVVQHGANILMACLIGF